MLQKAPTTANPEETAPVPPPAESDIAIALQKNRSKGWTRRLMILAVVVAAAGGGWFWWSHSVGGPAITYTTQPATRGDLSVTVTATGTVEPTNQVDVSSELSGAVGSVEVDFNDTVKQGQTLATLKSDKLAASVEQAKAQLAARQADVAQAQLNADQTALALHRAQMLLGSGVVTQEAVDTAKNANDRAEAALTGAKANQQIAAASLSSSQSDLAKATIVSPINGIVLSRAIEVGQTVAASVSAPVLFTLADDLTKMQLEVDIDEADVGKVTEGDDATFTVAAFDGRTFHGTVSQVRFAPATVEGVVTYKAILDVDNTDLSLRPGMTATADILVDNVTNALLVPNAALRFAPPSAAQPTTERSGGAGLLGLLRPPRPERNGGAPNGQATFVQNGAGGAPVQMRRIWVLRDGDPTAVAVRTGVTDGARTEVLGGGLSEGDAVIVGSKTAS